MLKRNFSKLLLSLVLRLFCCFLLANGDDKYSESNGKEYLKKLNAQMQEKNFEHVTASWNYDADLSDENRDKFLQANSDLATFTKQSWEETIKYPWQTYKDPDTKRQFKKYSVLGKVVLPPEKLNHFNKLISDMQSIYSKSKVCSYLNRTDCSFSLEPELTEIFAKSKDPDELRYYWEAWRKASGRPVRNMYQEYVDLTNEAAVMNNFTDGTELWLREYEAPDFKTQVEKLWEQLRPFYLQLHAFVRRRLRERYGLINVPLKGPIPSHLLGNMWAQTWINIFEFAAPYPYKQKIDVTSNLVNQGYTPLKMFKLAEEFFTSLGLDPMTQTFWKKSILEKPADGRDLVCHASAWDFFDGEDFRIKQCTRISMEDLSTIHHEMGHVQYFMEYRKQPFVYKDGSNPGFHEAVGDTIGLSVATATHLQKIGLMNSTVVDPQSSMNHLFKMALSKIAFLPFAYMMDHWRWGVFEKKITPENYNCKWWQMREKYQGLSAPVERSEEDFDPGAKYHTVADVPYIRYFVSYVIQFQFHRAMCIAAGQYDPKKPADRPLHECDVYKSKEAGNLLKKMLQLGSSKPWPDAMEVITGQRKMDAGPLMEYFDTLIKWLEDENKKTNEFIGWEPVQKECKGTSKKGNYEDENIGYSYAEFVRSDDNSFGFPDYIEETQPPYLSLRHRSEEKFQTNYYSPKEKVGQFVTANKPYPPNGVEDNEFIDLSRLKRLSELNAKTKKHQLLSHSAIHPVDKIPHHATNENHKRALDTEKIKFINELLQNIIYLGNKAAGPAHLTKGKTVLRRDVTSDEKQAEVRASDGNGQEKDGVDDNCVKKPKDKSASPADRGDECRDESKQECLNDKEILKICNGEVIEGDDEIMQLVTEVCFQKLSSTDVSCKIDLIRERIDKLLKNSKFMDTNPCKANSKSKGFNSVSCKPHRRLMIICLKKHVRPNGSQPKSSDCNRRSLASLNWTDYFKPANLYENIQPGYRSLGANSKYKKNFRSKENSNLGAISVELTGEGKNKIKIKKRPEDVDSTYVIFLGKSPTGKRKKKSYTEYHFRRKYPILYNDVVITAGGKTEKPEDHMSKKDPRLMDFSPSSEQFGYSVPKQEERYRVYPKKRYTYSHRNILHIHVCWVATAAGPSINPNHKVIMERRKFSHLVKLQNLQSLSSKQ